MRTFFAQKVNNYDRNINTIRLPILVYTGN